MSHNFEQLRTNLEKLVTGISVLDSQYTESRSRDALLPLAADALKWLELLGGEPAPLPTQTVNEAAEAATLQPPILVLHALEIWEYRDGTEGPRLYSRKPYYIPDFRMGEDTFELTLDRIVETQRIEKHLSRVLTLGKKQIREKDVRAHVERLWAHLMKADRKSDQYELELSLNRFLTQVEQKIYTQAQTTVDGVEIFESQEEARSGATTEASA